MSPSDETVHTLPIQVRFADTDALGHVNNAAYATYAEVARLAFFQERVGGTVRELGPDYGGLILARLAMDFRRQVLLGDEVAVTTRVARLGRSSIELEQQVLAGGEVAAEISSVVVTFDYGAQRPVPMPDSLREKLGGSPAPAGG